MAKEKFCLHCERLLKGRSDKKFCDDQCRSNYNREMSVFNAKYISHVNAALKKNRRILLKMNTHGKTTVLYKDLLGSGFDFGYFTSILQTKLGKRYFFCYEMGYLSINPLHVLLVKNNRHRRMQSIRIS